MKIQPGQKFKINIPVLGKEEAFIIIEITLVNANSIFGKVCQYQLGGILAKGAKRYHDNFHVGNIVKFQLKNNEDAYEHITSFGWFLI